jgi:hypothetical protein
MQYQETCEKCEESGVVFNDTDVTYCSCWFGELKEYQDKTDEIARRDFHFA